MDPSAELVCRLTAHLGDEDAAHDKAHSLRVWRNASEIAVGEGIAVDRTLMAASLLHDLVNLPKTHSDRSRASRMSAEAARPILSAEGFTAAEIDDVSHAIEAHSFSAGIAPRTDLARVLQDADRLEALGAIGIARVFSVSGALGRALWHPDDPFARDREPDDGNWSLDHFKIKLLRLSCGMNTATGRLMAEHRTARMQRYLSELEIELTGVASD